MTEPGPQQIFTSNYKGESRYASFHVGFRKITFEELVMRNLTVAVSGAAWFACRSCGAAPEAEDAPCRCGNLQSAAASEPEREAMLERIKSDDSKRRTVVVADRSDTAV